MALVGNGDRLAGETVTLTQIAEKAEVAASAASNWRKRHADFPQPVAVVSGQERFAADAVALWLGNRRVPRNRLRFDENMGVTYGDRFLRNSGATAKNAEATPPHADEAYRAEFVSQLWRIMDLLRGDFDSSSAFDFILAMLYIRKVNPELWRSVAELSSWGEMDSMLRRVPSWDYYVPASAAAPHRASGTRLREAFKLFDGIDLERASSAALFDELLNSSNRDLGRRGGHFTPASVADCLINILDPHQTSTVYDPSCGSGELLVATGQHGVKPLFGHAANERSLYMTNLNLLAHGYDGEVRIGGPAISDSDFPGGKFDFVLANPPFNVSLPDSLAKNKTWPFGEPGRTGGGFGWLQVAFGKLKPGGRAGVIMPNGSLFTGGRNGDIRREMVDAGVIDGIVALPAGLFMGTGIPVSIWFLRRPIDGEPAPSDVVFIDATSMGTKNIHPRRALLEGDIARIVREYSDCRNASRSGSSGDVARSVSLEEIRWNDYNLQPQCYLRQESELQDSPTGTASAGMVSLLGELDGIADLVNRTRQDVGTHLATLFECNAGAWDEAPLGDICSVQAGPAAVDHKQGLTALGRIPLLLPRNIKRGFLSHDELDTVSPEVSARLGNYLLQSGDIVCVRSGTLGRHGLVREDEDGWILGPSCMRIRPEAIGVLPEYLVHYLNSPEVLRWIRSESSRSTAIPHISAVRLRELMVPLPPIELQSNIVAAIDSIAAYAAQWQQGVSTVQSLRDLVFTSLLE